MEVKIISYNSEDYRLELELRDRVLRKPLGMNLYDENLDKEVSDVHIGAFQDEILIGVLILSFIGDETLKMRQVAVDQNSRSKKVGSKMVNFSENWALSNNFKIIELHARSTAVEFYQKLGYKIISEQFFEINIAHFKMRKVLASSI
ncbi:MAG: GNAT family N-acetyltransferase [Paludibacter sp.]|nr:GNAT family N-acetyltransferase [Paludibacter sp.]